MICTQESIRIFLPRIPARRPDDTGRSSAGKWAKWQEWFHVFRKWAMIDFSTGCDRPMPRVDGPCRVVVTIGWFERVGVEFPAESCRNGVLEALVRSGIATEIEEVVVARVGCAVEEMGTEVEIFPLEGDGHESLR